MQGAGLVLFCVKSTDTERAAAEIAPHLASDALVLSRMDGGILRVDTGMLASFYGGQAAALVIEDNELAVIYAVDHATSGMEMMA